MRRERAFVLRPCDPLNLRFFRSMPRPRPSRRDWNRAHSTRAKRRACSSCPIRGARRQLLNGIRIYPAGMPAVMTAIAKDSSALLAASDGPAASSPRANKGWYCRDAPRARALLMTRWLGSIGRALPALILTLDERPSIGIPDPRRDAAATLRLIRRRSRALSTHGKSSLRCDPSDS